jgi:Cytochrome C and Quinol oxidase polypeptide I
MAIVQEFREGVRDDAVVDRGGEESLLRFSWEVRPYLEMTGVLMAVPPADFQLHNSVFLVAHFHNIAIGGGVFAVMAGYSYWFPKAFGFKFDERWGRRQAVCTAREKRPAPHSSAVGSLPSRMRASKSKPFTSSTTSQLRKVRSRGRKAAFSTVPWGTFH